MEDDDAWKNTCPCGTNRHEPDNDTDLDFNGVWLGCDTCDRWVHGNCAGIHSQNQADKLNFFQCSICKPHDKKKRPPGRAPTGKVWDSATGIYVVDATVPQPSPKFQRTSPSTYAPNPTTASSDKQSVGIYGSGRSSRAFPNVQSFDDPPPPSTRAFDAQYWYNKMKADSDNRVNVAPNAGVVV